MSQGFSTRAIVLKRRNFSEADRLITLYSQDYGKITAIAKGVRKLKSTKKGALEPGTVSLCYFVKGKGSLYLLTQAKILSSPTGTHADLVTLTQTLQMLEIIDALTVEEEPNGLVFDHLYRALSLIGGHGHKKTALLTHINGIIAALGFGPPVNFSEADIRQYIEDLANQPLKTKKFLTASI